MQIPVRVATLQVSEAAEELGLVRVRADLSGMSESIIHLPQVHLRHNERPYVGKKLWHRSDLVPTARRNTEHCHFQLLD